MNQLFHKSPRFVLWWFDEIFFNSGNGNVHMVYWMMSLTDNGMKLVNNKNYIIMGGKN